jgi:hypothetical protein
MASSGLLGAGAEALRLIAGGGDKGIIDRGSDKCSEMMSYKRYNFIFIA